MEVRTVPQKDWFMCIPFELSEIICCYLSPEDLVQASRVSKSWETRIFKMTILWKTICDAKGLDFTTYDGTLCDWAKTYIHRKDRLISRWLENSPRKITGELASGFECYLKPPFIVEHEDTGINTEIHFRHCNNLNLSQSIKLQSVRCLGTNAQLSFSRQRMIVNEGNVIRVFEQVKQDSKYLEKGYCVVKEKKIIFIKSGDVNKKCISSKDLVQCNLYSKDILQIIFPAPQSHTRSEFWSLTSNRLIAKDEFFAGNLTCELFKNKYYGLIELDSGFKIYDSKGVVITDFSDTSFTKIKAVNKSYLVYLSVKSPKLLSLHSLNIVKQEQNKLEAPYSGKITIVVLSKANFAVVGIAATPALLRLCWVNLNVSQKLELRIQFTNEIRAHQLEFVNESNLLLFWYRDAEDFSHYKFCDLETKTVIRSLSFDYKCLIFICPKYLIYVDQDQTLVGLKYFG